MKAGGNLLYEPFKGLVLKAYYDIYGGDVYNNDSTIIVNDTASIHTLAFFTGYQTNKFRVGIEYDLQLNGKKFNEIAEGHHLSGFSIYGSYYFAKKWEVFAQGIEFISNKLTGETENWNYEEDGNVVIAGVQYQPVKGVKTAINYRTFLYDNASINDGHFVYLNFEFSF